MFQNYMLVISATGDFWPEARKWALLLHCLGTEGQRLFYTLPNTGENLADAIKALEEHFIPKRNVVVERHAFRKRVQRTDETVVQYIAALRHLATTCEFADNLDDMLRDQLVENIANPRIHERLLVESKLTLEIAITIATQLEAADAQAKSMATNNPAPVHAVHSTPASGRQRSKAKSSALSARTCFHCGSAGHLANAQNCPAASAKCKNCNKTGDFARVCRSAPTHSVHSVELPEVCILYLPGATDRLMCDVIINATPAAIPVSLQLTVDSGSSVSILPKQLYEQHFHTVPLHAPTSRLVTYLQEPISVLGCLPVTVSKYGLNCPAHFFIVDNGTALLGMDLIKGLQLRFDGNTVLPPPQSASVCELSTPPSQRATLGCVEHFTHKVNISDSVPPVRHKLHCLPFSVRDAVSAELQRLLHAGVIERIDSSPWVSPIVVVQKKTGGSTCVWICEGPNKAVIVDSYPLPHMEEMMTLLKGATVFSTIYLESAYHQVPLHEDSRDLTAFITHEGLFRFCKVPYGLASAPSAFQKMMVVILKGLQNVANYLDDIIVWGRTLQEHDQALQDVLQRLKDAGLVLNESKCQFRKQSLKFLGHMVTSQGIQLDQEHLSAIIDAPAPLDAVQLRSLLGLLSWYNKLIPNSASVLMPLRACLRDESGFRWSDEAQQSLADVKKLLVHSPALALFDPALPVVISTDASAYGLGAVFAQICTDVQERTVAFASRTLTSAEQKYSTVEKEALACVWAVERWRTYFWGCRFTLRTDHQALTTLLTTKGTDRAAMRIARWAARLLCFNYTVEYRAGSENHTVDCLSRLPLPLTSDAESDTEPEFVALLSTGPTAIWSTICKWCY
uniref:Reverse transcriptase domain-containing protein n=1 Tax=Cyprinus carpio TaxID=7962 RepID=A0A8C2ARP7_CYPCA